MDDKNQKEKLEQELRFLKESYEAEVISRDEYQKGTERVGQKLKEMNNSPNGQKDHEFFEQTEKKDESKNPETKTEEKSPEDSREDLKDKEENKLFKYAVVFVVLVLVAFFSYSLLSANNMAKSSNEAKFVALCSTNEDCRQGGQEGTCINPGKKDAKCEIRQMPKTNVIVLNGRKDCFNCDAQRVLSILEAWFGPLNPKEIDYESDEGKKFAELSDARLLPAFILEENITNKPAFEQFKQAFVKKNKYYVMSENAAGSILYFKRENMPNHLDLFIISGDASATKAENNLKEFLDNFKDAQFEKYFSNDKITQELGIKTFPTFLVNNRVKFTGIQTAETIKENYCSLNKADECKKNLSKSLV